MLNHTEHPRIDAIEFRAMTFRHTARDPLFDDVDFEFPLDTFVQIRGPQGSGVSSLLRILAATLEPNSGHYLINDFSVHENTYRDFRPYQVAIGYTFDQGGLISNRTLLQNLQLPMQFHGEMLRRESGKRAAAYLQRFEIEQYSELRPALASGGTRKAACLARAFVMRPTMMILDNPTQGLNKHGIETLVEMINWHREEFGLRHIFAGTEDEMFLEAFDHVTVEIENKGLRQVA